MGGGSGKDFEKMGGGAFWWLTQEQFASLPLKKPAKSPKRRAEQSSQ